MVQKILLDTNFLMIPGLFGVDIFSEIDRICEFKYSVHVVDKTLQELNAIIENSQDKNHRAAKMALALIQAKHLNIIHTESKKYLDDFILDINKDREFIIATQDKELKRRLKGCKLIVLRQKKRLELV